jgi:excisionase family DNA binding protein
MDDLLTYDEASKLLNLKLGTLYARVAQSRVPHVRLGRRLTSSLFRPSQPLVAVARGGGLVRHGATPRWLEVALAAPDR